MQIQGVCCFSVDFLQQFFLKKIYVVVCLYSTFNFLVEAPQNKESRVKSITWKKSKQHQILEELPRTDFFETPRFYLNILVAVLELMLHFLALICPKSECRDAGPHGGFVEGYDPAIKSKQLRIDAKVCLQKREPN